MKSDEKVDVNNITMPHLYKEFGALKLPELIRKTLIGAMPKCLQSLPDT